MPTLVVRCFQTYSSIEHWDVVDAGRRRQSVRLPFPGRKTLRKLLAANPLFWESSEAYHKEMCNYMLLLFSWPRSLEKLGQFNQMPLDSRKPTRMMSTNNASNTSLVH
jgi:hypothetical protein